MKGKHLGTLAAMALMMADDSMNKFGSKTSESDIDFTKPVPPVPKGCKRYYYNEVGPCCQSEAKVYFDAMKPSSAKRKYDNWKKANNEKNI